MNFPQHFLLGAATAAHQVEGNNTNSDLWAQEQCPHSTNAEPSLDACDHYHRFAQDIALMADAGLNAYRFSVEWARIEPEEGRFDEAEIAHYGAVLDCCRTHGLEPIVTLHHFSSPKWLITKGGWEAESTVEYFARYCRYVVEKLGDKMNYVCTINEANMGLQMAAMVARMMKQGGGSLQIGVDPTKGMAELMMEQAQAFGVSDPQEIHVFLSPKSLKGDQVIMRAHAAAREAIRAVNPKLKVGLTLSLHDIQPLPGGEDNARRIWEDEFTHYLPYLREDDFVGVQNYTRELVDESGICTVPEGCPLTQMNYEDYPAALGHVIRRVAAELSLPILVTENGIATTDDQRRIDFVREALDGVKGCIADGIDVRGYLYWSFIDNYEFAKAFTVQFGLVAMDRATKERKPKPSLSWLGAQR